MKLLYEILVIDLATNEWSQRRAWPVRLALAAWGLLVELLATANAVRDAIRVVATVGHVGLAVILADLGQSAGLLGRAEHAQCALQIAATAGRAAAAVIWTDLTYGLAGAFVGKGMAGVACA